MKTSEKTQIQVRIDVDTKNKAKKILENIGMDASTAVNILFKQIVRSGTLPIDLRDINGFAPQKASELKESIKDAEQSKKSFKNTKMLMNDLLA
jgi:addiction module RelB/DinJ family antitoxin